MANEKKMVSQKSGAIFPEILQGSQLGQCCLEISKYKNKTKKCPSDWATRKLLLTMMKAGLMKWWGQSQARGKEGERDEEVETACKGHFSK